MMAGAACGGSETWQENATPFAQVYETTACRNGPNGSDNGEPTEGISGGRLRFTDVNGSAVRVLTKQIAQVREWTKEQRAADREFRRARRLEDKAERRPWDEDD